MPFRLAPMRTLAAAVTLTAAAVAAPSLAAGEDVPTFRRIATFPVFLNTSVDVETVAEIVTASPDGNTLIYSDSEQALIGFVDITDPANPVADGIVDVGGEPTAVAATADGYALVSINTSESFTNPSGTLLVIDIETREIVRTFDLGGQPDSIAVNRNSRWAVVCIENERDEDLGNGEPPQLPAGFLVTLSMNGPVADWSTSDVNLTGVADLFPEDPEPEFVDISPGNIAAVTLQENNHIVLVHVPTGRIIEDFPAGTVDLEGIDVSENDLIEQTGSLTDVPREPDAVAWLSPVIFATADEGDLYGGSRGFTTFFRRNGITAYEAGTSIENLVTRLGHYPENRSENKGNEPEGLEFGDYAGGTAGRYLFVGSERSNLVAVYSAGSQPNRGPLAPELVQVLPAGSGPEGLLAIPERDLFVVACENDDRGDGIRSSLMIYQRNAEPNYPTVISSDRPTGTPIPWAALSGLVVDPADADVAYTVHDSFYQRSRVYTMDISAVPAVINAETVITDADGLLNENLFALEASLPKTALGDFDPASIVNPDGTVNLDLEGVTVDPSGAIWVCSEGRGNLAGGVSDPESRPFESPNVIVRLDDEGVIDFVAFPPLELTLEQFRFGFEGIAAVDLEAEGVRVAVAFQRAWTGAGDPSGEVARLGLLDPTTGEWTFAYYPLDKAISPNGGWIGLGDLVSRDGQLVVVERDNQGGPDAAVKRLYTVPLDPADFRPAGETLVVLQKTLVRDILAEGDYAVTGGFVPEKLEGLMILPGGRTWIVNDNDGVDDNNGETQLLDIGDLFD